MKLAVSVPSQRNLESAYAKLLYPKALTLQQVIEFSQWGRFDPRLAQIWVGYLSNHWEEWDPLRFGQQLIESTWPAAVGVLLEFATRLAKKDDANSFIHWRSLVLSKVEKASGELFFMGLRKIGGYEMAKDAEFPTEEYATWGYLGRENLIPKKGTVSYSKQTRLRILRSLCEKYRYIKVQDYHQEILACVSLRQAERDLQNSKFLRAIGNSSGRRWVSRIKNPR